MSAVVVASTSDGSPELDALDAETLTVAITDLVGQVSHQLTRVYGLLVEAYVGRAHMALGYGGGLAGWDAYCLARLGILRSLRLPADTRLEVVRDLTAAGLSSRGVGAVIGVNQKTVVRDLARASEAGASVQRPRAVTGLDGRQRPAAGKSAARALPAAPGRPKTLQVLELLTVAGEQGLTWAELSERTGWHHGIASASLSRLERRGRVVRTAARRGGCGVYVRSDVATDTGH